MIMLKGQQQILKTYLDSQEHWYICLGHGALPAKTVLLSAATQVTGTGYAKAEVNSADITMATVGDYVEFTCPQVTFTGGAGGWNQADWAGFCSTSDNTGDLVAVMALVQPAALVENGVMKVTFKLTDIDELDV